MFSSVLCYQCDHMSQIYDQIDHQIYRLSQIKEYSPESPTLTKRIDLITDNAGFELISDLCLVSVLLELGLAERITLRVKSHPLFVSDAMVKDVVLHLDEMKKVSVRNCASIVQNQVVNIVCQVKNV